MGKGLKPSVLWKLGTRTLTNFQDLGMSRLQATCQGWSRFATLPSFLPVLPFFHLIRVY